eukprot:6948052-Lingulodinium_polyedra.AAC.1
MCIRDRTWSGGVWQCEQCLRLALSRAFKAVRPDPVCPGASTSFRAVARPGLGHRLRCVVCPSGHR